MNLIFLVLIFFIVGYDLIIGHTIHFNAVFLFNAGDAILFFGL